MKTCSKCLVDKDPSDFHIRKASKDGLSPKCKECAREYDQERLANKDRAEKRAAYQKSEKGRSKASAAKARWILKNSKKRKAHYVVTNAVRDGRMTKKPCEICGSTKRIHAHHDDYDFPMIVRWLCPAHHSEWHRINGEALNPS